MEEKGKIHIDDDDNVDVQYYVKCKSWEIERERKKKDVQRMVQTIDINFECCGDQNQTTIIESNEENEEKKK